VIVLTVNDREHHGEGADQPADLEDAQVPALPGGIVQQGAID
jgi:hypothetical protein